MYVCMYKNGRGLHGRGTVYVQYCRFVVYEEQVMLYPFHCRDNLLCLVLSKVLREVGLCATVELGAL